jgi:hypothetical protein
MKILYLMAVYWWVFAALFGVAGALRLLLGGVNIQ